MNFYQYIGVTKDEFVMQYLDTRLVNEQSHPEFPLDIYSYGRACVHENKWDDVTRKCRGIIVNRDTEEVVARPFEKFFNFGQSDMPETDPETWEDDWPYGQPIVWEKVDGFLCTLYHWKGKNYIASKGSFTSPHAKWATSWIQSSKWTVWADPKYTPVFEGVNPNLRIVVDYGKRQELVLLAIVNNETGEEYGPGQTQLIAKSFDTPVAKVHDIGWQEAHARSYDDMLKNEEGYVLTWYREGMTPFRLKVKFADYLRLHRMVTGVSPKHILEVLQNGWTTEMDGLLNESTPWFNKFVSKWKRVIEAEFNRIEHGAKMSFDVYRKVLLEKSLQDQTLPTRKDWALLFNRPESKEFASIMFAMLDGKDEKPVIWKMVKNASFMKNGHPMRDAHSL